MSETVSLNNPVPSFDMESTEGELNSSSWKGSHTVLFFYPRNNTPGCTTESKDFRDLHEEFKKLDCKVYGISRDTLGSHKRVVQKLELPYPLIADPEEVICNIFGVMKHKKMFGKPVRGIERSTFLFNKDGVLIKEWRKVSVSGHAQEVLNTVRENQ